MRSTHGPAVIPLTASRLLLAPLGAKLTPRIEISYPMGKIPLAKITQWVHNEFTETES